MISRLSVYAALGFGALGLAAAVVVSPPAARATVRPHRLAVTPAATAPCGPYCANYFTQGYGPGFILNDRAARAATGTRVTLSYASNVRRAEDWTIWPAGTVRQLAAFGLVSRKLALHYGPDQAFEAQFAPYGVPTGLCAGLGRPAASGESVTLQWCGVTGRTVWITDVADGSAGYAPLINGSDRNFSDPQVLTEPGAPARRTRPQLMSFRLQKFASGTVYDDQMWANSVGMVP
jgi:hypothetical protein